MKLKIISSFCFALFTESIEPDKISNKNITWVALGDSLTEYNFKEKYHYFDYVAQDLSHNIINLGVSGTVYKEDGVSEGFYKRIEKI